MTRLKNWQSRFAEVVAAARTRPFSWGTHDCCLWAADSVRAVLGRDPAAKWRGTYDTEAAALALVERLGGLPAIAALGGSEIAPALAIAGDVGLVRWPDGVVSLGVAGGAGRWLMAADAGLVTLTDGVLRVWGVGRV